MQHRHSLWPFGAGIAEQVRAIRWGGVISIRSYAWRRMHIFTLLFFSFLFFSPPPLSFSFIFFFFPLGLLLLAEKSTYVAGGSPGAADECCAAVKRCPGSAPVIIAQH